MKRYLEVINGVAQGECETTGELPPQVLMCSHRDEDGDVVSHDWNPQRHSDADKQAFLDAHAAHEGFQDRRIVDVTSQPGAKLFMDYDLATGTFSRGAAFAAARAKDRRLTHADVLALLTPTEWSDMNKFHPQAAGVSTGGVPLNDAQVFWAVSVFNKAAYIDLNDSRFGSIIALLTAKGILTPARALELQQQMAARAAAK